VDQDPPVVVAGFPVPAETLLVVEVPVDVVPVDVVPAVEVPAATVVPVVVPDVTAAVVAAAALFAASWAAEANVVALARPKDTPAVASRAAVPVSTVVRVTRVSRSSRRRAVQGSVMRSSDRGAGVSRRLTRCQCALFDPWGVRVARMREQSRNG
jgi:hypothetical protein